MKVVLLIVVGLLVGACMTPAAMMSDRLGEVQRMADAAARAYSRPLAGVQIGEVPEGTAAQYLPRTMTIRLSNRALWSHDWWFWYLVSHEIAHHVLDHRRSDPPLEIAADLEAVLLLQRFRGMSEGDATDLVWQFYCTRRWENRPVPGHPPNAEKMLAFQGRYGKRSCAR